MPRTRQSPENATRESTRVEFKERLDPKERRDWCEVIKDIVAIANSGGGNVILGRSVAYLWGGMSKPTHSLSKLQTPLTHRRHRVFEGRGRQRLDSAREAIRRLQTRVRAVETTLDPLVDHVAHAEQALGELDARVTQLERSAAHRARRERAS